MTGMCLWDMSHISPSTPSSKPVRVARVRIVLWLVACFMGLITQLIEPIPVFVPLYGTISRHMGQK